MRKTDAVKRACVAVAAVAVVMLPAAALAQGSTAPPSAPVVHPETGQTPETQRKDEGECSASARQQTGYDPAPRAQGAAASGTGSGAETSNGAAMGGANGAGKGAAMGAAAGDVAAQELTANGEKLASYDKAFSACMKGRGYTVE